MSFTDCAVCAALASQGVGTEEREICPTEAAQLERFGPGGGHGDSAQIRRCSCGTLYQYRFHYEYDVGGSWDEHYLWRIPGQGQDLLTRALDDSASVEDRCTAITQALRHPKHQVRRAAALTCWILADQDVPLDGAMEVMVRKLADRVSTVGGGCYRALLTLVHTGPGRAQLLLDHLDATGVEKSDKRLSWILRRDAQQVVDEAAG